MIVRAPNHLGDVVMALPALQVGAHDVLVVRGLSPLLQMASVAGEVLPLDRGARGFAAAARRLRARGETEGVLLPPSLSSALLFRAGGVRSLRGTATDGRTVLLREPVDPASYAGLHRSERYWRLVHGTAAPSALVPRLSVPPAARAAWDALAGTAANGAVGIFPGSNAPSRRWAAERFAALAARLADDGLRVVAFGGPAERALTARVAEGARQVLDLGGRTDLPTLAAGLASLRLLVSNDSGPLHLAAAVGTRTVSLWGPGDPAVTGPLDDGHRVLRRTELPCVPCIRNECPRHGPGFVLPDARQECLQLIGVDEVQAAVRSALQGAPAR